MLLFIKGSICFCHSGETKTPPKTPIPSMRVITDNHLFSLSSSFFVFLLFFSLFFFSFFLCPYLSCISSKTPYTCAALWLLRCLGRSLSRSQIWCMLTLKNDVWTCDERGGFTKGGPRQGPVGASEITQTEILRSYNETRIYARKTSARWSEKTMDRWYRSMGRQKPGRNGKTGGEQKGLPVLNSWSRLRSYIGHGKLMMWHVNGCYENKFLSTLWPWADFTNGPDAAVSSAPTLIRHCRGKMVVKLSLQKHGDRSCRFQLYDTCPDF